MQDTALSLTSQYRLHTAELAHTFWVQPELCTSAGSVILLMQHEYYVWHLVHIPHGDCLEGKTGVHVQVQKVHVDVGVQGVTVDFCGNAQVSFDCLLGQHEVPSWQSRTDLCHDRPQRVLHRFCRSLAQVISLEIWQKHLYVAIVPACQCQRCISSL